MSEAKGIEALTGWITYDLQPTEYLAEPCLKVRLRFMDSLEMTDAITRNHMSAVIGARELAMEAVAEWDLTVGGKPIPVTEATKATYLRPLLAEPLAVTEEERKKAEEAGKEPYGMALAFAIARDAQKRTLFLKN